MLTKLAVIASQNPDGRGYNYPWMFAMNDNCPRMDTCMGADESFGVHIVQETVTQVRKKVRSIGIRGKGTGENI